MRLYDRPILFVLPLSMVCTCVNLSYMYSWWRQQDIENTSRKPNKYSSCFWSTMCTCVQILKKKSWLWQQSKDHTFRNASVNPNEYSSRLGSTAFTCVQFNWMKSSYDNKMECKPLGVPACIGSRITTARAWNPRCAPVCNDLCEDDDFRIKSKGDDHFDLQCKLAAGDEEIPCHGDDYERVCASIVTK